MFGPTIPVKLDLFHAVQQISQTLSRKHPLMQQCLQELRLVFRCDGDSGKARLSATPLPEIIHAKLNALLAKWADMANE